MFYYDRSKRAGGAGVFNILSYETLTRVYYSHLTNKLLIRYKRSFRRYSGKISVVGENVSIPQIIDSFNN